MGTQAKLQWVVSKLIYVKKKCGNCGKGNPREYNLVEVESQASPSETIITSSSTIP